MYNVAKTIDEWARNHIRAMDEEKRDAIRRALIEIDREFHLERIKIREVTNRIKN